MNSRNKGANGEREAAEFLRAHGFLAKRGQQHAGGVDSPDVITDLPFHVEVKRVEKLNLEAACDQARKDSAGGQWIVLHRKNRKPWLVTIDAEEFLKLVSKFHSLKQVCSTCRGLGMIPGEGPDSDVMNTPCVKCNPNAKGER